MINDYSALLQLPCTIKYPKGLIICQEGGGGGDMYYLLDGTVGAYKGNTQIDSYGPGHIFGELSLFLGQPRESKIIALTDVTLVTINRQNIYSIYSGQPELTYRIMERMCRRIDQLQRMSQTAPVQNIPAASPQLSAAQRPAASAPAAQPPALDPTVARIRQSMQSTAQPQQPAGKAPAKSAAAASSTVAPVSGKNYAKTATVNWQSSLFPKNHGTYTLPLNNNLDGIYTDPCRCPVCGETFSSLKVIITKLRQESTDSDLRIRYKDIDPMYYDIISCPNCLYSASVDQYFSISAKLAARITQELAPFRQDVVIQTGLERDSFTVISGYYLAILCAPICFDNAEMSQARHWQKLSRIYQDSGDDAMYRNACQESLKAFQFAYNHYDYSSKQIQQMCFIIGDLYQKLGDLEKARRYFYDAKSNRDGTSVMKRNADIRLEEIKALLQE